MKTRFDWKAAYFHVVGLVAIITLLIAVIAAGHAALRLAFPTLSLDSYQWQQVRSFAAYKRATVGPGPKGRAPIEATGERETGAATMSEDELRQAWEEYRSLVVEGERHDGLWQLMQSFITVVITLPIFWWHRRAAKRLRPVDEGDD
ncbi:MAG: hypothetical protein AB1792_02085 [Candidatus Zixiibacteriota bacterium]